MKLKLKLDNGWLLETERVGHTCKITGIWDRGEDALANKCKRCGYCERENKRKENRKAWKLRKQLLLSAML
jgi:hypothetical protein